MNVEQLIEKLSNLDPNTVVATWAPAFAVEMEEGDIMVIPNLEIHTSRTEFYEADAIVIGGN